MERITQKSRMYGDKCRDYNDLGGERLKLLLSSNALHHRGSGRGVCESVRMFICAREGVSCIHLCVFGECAAGGGLSAERSVCVGVCLQ